MQKNSSPVGFWLMTLWQEYSCVSRVEGEALCQRFKKKRLLRLKPINMA